MTQDQKALQSIPLIKADLPTFDAIKNQFAEILASGRVTNYGKYLTEFERAAGQYLGSKTVAVSSGTAGLILTLQALGLKPGDKVILPSFTFVATAQAILYAGGIPVFAEIEEDLTLSVGDLDALLDEHKDAAWVIPVHMYGLPCRIDEIAQVVEKHSRKRSAKIRLIYDAAHAFGSTRAGKKVGTFGDAEVFSLSVTKALTTGEGGLVSTQDPLLVEKLRQMRNYGMPPGTYNASLPGLNSKMSEFHAIVGIENLKNLPAILTTRKEKADYLKGKILEKTSLPTVPCPEDVRHTYKDFSVIFPRELKDKRAKIMDSLKEQGVETRAYFYPPVHEQDFFRRFSTRKLPRTEDLSRRVLTLPFFTTLTASEMNHLADCLKRSLEACS